MFPAERPHGVRVPDQQLRPGGSGTPGTVGSIVPLQLYAVQYFDENGQEHHTVVYKMGPSVYFDVNAERWAAGLRQAAGFIAQAVNAEHTVLMSPPTPAGDQVDILAVEESSAKDRSAP